MSDLSPKSSAVDPANAAPIPLRGHHFLCILTYKGLGYSPAFVAGMTGIVRQIEAGRPVRLIDGSDAICAGLSAEAGRACDHDCALPATRHLDALAVEAVQPLLEDDLQAPVVLTKAVVGRLRAAFADGTIRKACALCRWSALCDEIAASEFRGVLLFT